MASSTRHSVGTRILSGYITIRPQEERLFGPDPGPQGRMLGISFGEGKKVLARLHRTSGKESQLRIAFTGNAGRPLRSWLRKNCRPRRVRRPRKVLVLTPSGPDQLTARIESLQQAVVEVLRLGPRRYFAGARPVSILHPALIDLDQLLQRVAVPRLILPQRLRGNIHQALLSGNWKQVPSVGGGLSIPAELRRAGAQLHTVLQPEHLHQALISLAAAFELGGIDLGVLLVADGPLVRRLRQPGTRSASLQRAVRDIQRLSFVIRGPLCVIALSMRKTLR